MLFRSAVRAALAELDLDPPDEVVEFFTWRTVISSLGFAGIFWETAYHSFEEMVATYRRNLQVGVSFGPLTQDNWPGPRTRFPILMMDDAEIVSVECHGDDRGSVWFAFTQEPAFKMFSSLGSAIESALYSAESGYWTWCVEDQMVRADRDWMAWPGDLEQPPGRDPRHRGP